MAEIVSARLLKARRQNRGSILVRAGIYIFIVPFYVVLYFIIEDQIEERVQIYEDTRKKYTNPKTVVYFPFIYIFTNYNYNTLYYNHNTLYS